MGNRKEEGERESMKRMKNLPFHPPGPCGPQGPLPGPQLSVGHGATVSVDGILPSLSSEAWTLDQRSRAEVAYGSHQFDVAVGGGVVVCARRGDASARRDGMRNFIFLRCWTCAGYLWVYIESNYCSRSRRCSTNPKKITMQNQASGSMAM
jgi:hypothetical protein